MERTRKPKTRARKRRNGCFPLACILVCCTVGLALGLLGRGMEMAEGLFEKEPLAVKPLNNMVSAAHAFSPQEDAADPQPEETADEGESSLSELTEDDLYSAAALLIRRSDGKVLLDFHGDSPIWPASMTKIMTAWLGVSNLEPGQTVTLPEEIFTPLYQANASLAGFLPGEKVTAEDLLYGVLLPSGAEAAAGVELLVSGGEAAFVEEMNREASRLGMDHTNFVNSSGLHHPDHTSTCEDLAKLLDTALENQWFREIFTAHSHTAYGSYHTQGFQLTSTLWSRITWEQPADWTLQGGKTGFTNDAGQCLASLAEKDGEEYILVTAGAPGDGQTEAYHIWDAYTVYSAI